MKVWVRTALIVLGVPVVAFGALWLGLYFTQGRHPTRSPEPELTLRTCAPGQLRCVAEEYGTPGTQVRGQHEVSVRKLAEKLGCTVRRTDEPFVEESGSCFMRGEDVGINVFALASDRRMWLDFAQDPRHPRATAIVVGDYWTVTAVSCDAAREVQNLLGGRVAGDC